jgi:hypothetical protein
VQYSTEALDGLASYLHDYFQHELWMAVVPNLPSRFGEARL